MNGCKIIVEDIEYYDIVDREISEVKYNEDMRLLTWVRRWDEYYKK